MRAVETGAVVRPLVRVIRASIKKLDQRVLI